jgi:DNA ligase 1
MDSLAIACEEVAGFNSRLKKVAIFAAYLRTLDDGDLGRAVRFLSGDAVFEGGAKLSVGSATLRDAARAATGWDEQIAGICFREVGDSGETISLLVEGRTAGQPMSLADAEILYARLAKARGPGPKVELLRDCFARYRPLTLRYFVKVITGNLRIGLQAKMLEEAVASATGAPHEAVRLANNRLGDLSRVALAARHGELARIEARLFHPMDFMLAKPLESLTDLASPQGYWVEDKYDGIRAQAHIEDGKVALFSRGMEDVTRAFPEICQACRQLPGSVLLDGEILAWREGRALPFAVLQQRLARKQVAAGMMEEIPTVFMAYDLLYRNGAMLVDLPIEERRRLLVETLATGAVLPAPQMTAASAVDIDRFFDEARARGNEGLVIKRRGSLYEPGRRSGAWYKIKRPYGTLDVVITAAEQGHGRRATVLSDYTFGVRSGDRFVNVGKAYSGLTDVEIRELTRLLRSLATERFSRVLLVKPEVVLEVAFDGVQKSPRHKSGYALRFPRILRWRKEKRPEEADNIDTVRALYEACLQR